jgi:DNA-binding XRE family transcriptional regulator
MYSLESRLRELAEQRQLTLTDVEAASRIPYTTLRRIGQENANPSIAQALVLARVLSVNVEEIFELAPSSGTAGDTSDRSDG